MTDKVKSATSQQGREMSREQLVRSHFDAYSDLVWAQDLEPKFREYDLDPESVLRYRDQWNAHTEKRDWEWWQNHVKDWSNEKLRAEIAECIAEIEAFGLRQSARDQAATDCQTFHDIVNRASDSERGTPEPMLTKERKM